MKNFIMLKNNKNKKDNFLIILSIIIILLIWKIISEFVSSDIIFPSPEKTVIRLFEIVSEKGFLKIILFSVLRGLLGFSLSFIIGTTLGVISGFNKVFFKMFEPVIVAVKSTPLMSIILIALIWLKSTNVPVFASFLVSFPIIYTNIVEGIKNVDFKVIEMANLYKVKRARILSEIYLPAIMPFIISSSLTSLGIGWKAVIAAEVLSNPEYAIGTNMQISKIYLQTDKVIAWTVIVVLIGFIFEKTVRLVEKRIVRWK